MPKYLTKVLDFYKSYSHRYIAYKISNMDITLGSGIHPHQWSFVKYICNGRITEV